MPMVVVYHGVFADKPSKGRAVIASGRRKRIENFGKSMRARVILAGSPQPLTAAQAVNRRGW